MYVILVYDIKSDEGGQNVLSKTFKTCKKYLSHIQNSVFEGELSNSQIVKLQYELNGIIRRDRDSIILFKSRNERWLEKTCGEYKKTRQVTLFSCLPNIV